MTPSVDPFLVVAGESYLQWRLPRRTKQELLTLKSNIWRRNKVEDETFGDKVHGFYQGILNVQKSPFFGTGVRVINGMFARKNSTAFRPLISSEHTSAQQHYVQVGYTGFCTNRTVNVGIADRTLCRCALQWNVAFTAPILDEADSIQWCGQSLWRVVSKCDEECTQYGQNILYALKWSRYDLHRAELHETHSCLTDYIKILFNIFFPPDRMKQMTKGLQIPVTSSPWDFFFFLPWLLMFVQPQYGTCCMSPFGGLAFELVSVFLENVCTLEYRQYGQNFLHSLRLTAVIFMKFIIIKCLWTSHYRIVFTV